VQVDIPEVRAELERVFADYERALVANDVEALVAFFRDAPETVRYGVADAQYGFEELAAFRRSQAQATPPRELRRTVVTTFGTDFGVASTEFVPDGTQTVGRQSQTWLRTADGWRIVSAHVSWIGGAGA
jgi:hypothetical protein